LDFFFPQAFSFFFLDASLSTPRHCKLKKKKMSRVKRKLSASAGEEENKEDSIIIASKRNKPCADDDASCLPPRSLSKQPKQQHSFPDLSSMSRSDDVLCYLHRDCAVVSLVMDGLHVVGIPQKTHVFRGTPAQNVMAFVPPAHQPAYYSDIDTARVYAQGDESRCVGYRAKRDIWLIDLSDAANIALLHKRLEGEERLVFEIFTGYGRTRMMPEDVLNLNPSCYYKKKPKDEIRICTEGFMTEQDHKEGRYISRRMAEILCRMGNNATSSSSSSSASSSSQPKPKLDGWVFGQTWRRGNGAPFHGEVLLCDPMDVVEVSQKTCHELEENHLSDIRRAFHLRSNEDVKRLMQVFHKLGRWGSPEFEFEQLLEQMAQNK